MATTTITPTQTRRKWRVAATSIKFLTRLRSLTRKTFARKRWRQAFHAVRSTPRVSPADIAVIDILPPTTTTSSFDLGRAALAAALVRDKNLDGLRSFGDIDGVLAVLHTHSGDGISGDCNDLRVRTEAFGCNNYPMINSISLKKLVRNYIARSYKDVVFYASFFLSFGVRICSQHQGWKEGGYMLLIALVYSVLSLILDFGVEKFLDRSVRLTTTRLFECSTSSVLRSGSEQLIPISQIVVGDVIVLKACEDVLADGLLIDESPLTVRELNSVSNNGIEVNNSMNPFLFSGSRVMTGTAKMVVTAVGTNTRLWEKQAVASVNHSTALQVEVQTLISDMKKVSFRVALVVLVVMLARNFGGNSRDEQGNREFNGGKTRVGNVLYMIMQIILETITVGLAMDSESYLWVVKICQGYKIKKMADDGILVRKLSALEKMGSVTSVVVTEKTGKFTQTQLSEFREAGVTVSTVDKQENISDEEIQTGSVDSAAVRTVRLLKQSGDVVAILARDDDENVDALALEEAHIRVFMSSGSDDNQRHKIAKAESYDAFILNVDHFPSIIKLLMWRRCVLENTRKLIHFQLTAGVACLLNSFIYLVSRSQTPTIDHRLVYSLLQLVWVNLILGLLAAVALTREEPRLRVNNKKRLIYGSMWRNIAAQVVYQTALFQVLQYKGESIFGIDKRQNDTMSYVLFFSCQVLNMFNARKVEEKNVFEGIWKNRVFMVIIAAIIVMQMVFVDILHKVVDLEMLDWEQKFKCVGLPFASLLVGLLVKLVPVPY